MYTFTAERENHMRPHSVTEKSCFWCLLHAEFACSTWSTTATKNVNSNEKKRSTFNWLAKLIAAISYFTSACNIESFSCTGNLFGLRTTWTRYDKNGRTTESKLPYDWERAMWFAIRLWIFVSARTKHKHTDSSDRTEAKKIATISTLSRYILENVCIRTNWRCL